MTSEFLSRFARSLARQPRAAWLLGALFAAPLLLLELLPGVSGTARLDSPLGLVAAAWSSFMPFALWFAHDGADVPQSLREALRSWRLVLQVLVATVGIVVPFILAAAIVSTMTRPVVADTRAVGITIVGVIVSYTVRYLLLLMPLVLLDTEERGLAAVRSSIRLVVRHFRDLLPAFVAVFAGPGLAVTVLILSLGTAQTSALSALVGAITSIVTAMLAITAWIEIRGRRDHEAEAEQPVE